MDEVRNDHRYEIITPGSDFVASMAPFEVENEISFSTFNFYL